MLKNIPLFFERFGLSYFREGACIEFFINPSNSPDIISSALILSYDARKKDLHVSRFYPELYRLPDSKYMSATCFYLLVQHCINVFVLDDASHISLETIEETSDRFYRKLGDFNFTVIKHGLGSVVEMMSGIMKPHLDTSMITVHIYGSGEIPFLKD